VALGDLDVGENRRWNRGHGRSVGAVRHRADSIWEEVARDNHATFFASTPSPS